jgi:hypothetical protein
MFGACLFQSGLNFFGFAPIFGAPLFDPGFFFRSLLFTPCPRLFE